MVGRRRGVDLTAGDAMDFWRHEDRRGVSTSPSTSVGLVACCDRGRVEGMVLRRPKRPPRVGCILGGGWAARSEAPP